MSLYEQVAKRIANIRLTDRIIPSQKIYVTVQYLHSNESKKSQRYDCHEFSIVLKFEIVEISLLKMV